MKNDRVFKENLHKIDRIKDELFDVCCKLEESGNKMKAKSLRTIIDKLEYWEHTTGK